MKNHMQSKLFCLTCLCAAMTPAHAQVSVGNWLDMATVKSVLTNGWQVGLNTDKDPANNNQWNTHDGGNGFGPGGLFGGLQETQLETAFGPPRRYPPVSAKKTVVTVPNATDSPITNSVTLEYTTSDSVTDSSSNSNSLKTGAEISFKVSASAFGIGAESGGKFSEDFTRTTGNSNAKTQVRSERFTNTLTVTVPARRSYTVTVSCQEDKVDLPYRSDIRLSGISHTWFPDRVNDHFNWNLGVGGVLSHANNLPRDWHVEGVNSVLIAGAQGILTAQQSTNCVAATTDNGGIPTASLQSALGTSPQALVPAGATLISVTPLNR